MLPRIRPSTCGENFENIVEDVVLKNVGVNRDEVSPDAGPVGKREFNDLPVVLGDARGVHKTS